MEAVRIVPCPSIRLELQRFLGLINFYRRLLRGAAKLLFPLNEALKGPFATLPWILLMDKAFIATKSALATATESEHPQADLPISLMVDTSPTHVGAVLQLFHLGPPLLLLQEVDARGDQIQHL